MRGSSKKSRTDSVSIAMGTAAAREKFNALVESFATDLYRYAYWLCGDRSVAEDLVQETFLRAWGALDSLREVRTAKSWLFTIVRRENARRFERKQPEIADGFDCSVVESATDYDTSTEAFALRQAMRRLSPEYREALVMQVIGGFSCNEIAQALGVSPSAVMTRLFRARKTLRDMLEERESNGTSEANR